MLSILLGSLAAFTLISTAVCSPGDSAGNGVIYSPEKITYSAAVFSIPAKYRAAGGFGGGAFSVAVLTGLCAASDCR